MGHSIAMINMQAGVAAHVLDSNPDAAKVALERIADSSSQTLSEIRATLGLLRSDALPTEGAEPPLSTGSLERLVDDTRAAGMPVQLTIDGDISSELGSPELTTAYRILQESLTNVAKHALDVTKVDIRVHGNERDLELEVVNDGTPALVHKGPGSGHGVEGMRERVRAIGGDLRVGPEPGGGFAVRAVIPRWVAA
jgi:signal transduction histidine kinase